MCSAPRADDGVDLVDDHGAHSPQHPPAAVRREEEIQRLRGGHQDVGRRAHHRGPLSLRRIAGSHGSGDPGRLQPGLYCQAVNAGARLREVLVNVRAERLERRHVDDADLVGQRRCETLFKQRIDGGEEGRECFA